MKLTVNNIQMEFNDREVKSCKRVVSNFIDMVRESADNNLSPTYYFTFLLIMHLMSQSLIDEFDAKTMASIINRLKVEE